MLTTTQAAAVLGIQPRTVTRFIERGLIKATKYGRDYLIDEAEITRYQQQRRKAGRPQKPKH